MQILKRRSDAIYLTEMGAFIARRISKRTTTGYTIQVAVEEATREMCFVSPAILFERMGVTP